MRRSVKNSIHGKLSRKKHPCCMLCMVTGSMKADGITAVACVYIFTTSHGRFSKPGKQTGLHSFPNASLFCFFVAVVQRSIPACMMISIEHLRNFLRISVFC